MEEAFLASIVDKPDDDAPRLIFADWLDEHGQPERAEFIRVQCQLAQLECGIDPLRDYAWSLEDAYKGQDHCDLLGCLCTLAEQDQAESLRQALREREQALYAEFGKTWIEPLLTMGLRCDDCPFHRGMIENVFVDPEDLLIHADTLFRRYPVRKLTLRMMESGQACRAALALSYMVHLRSLEMWWFDEDVPEGLGNALAATPSLTNLSRLAVTQAGEHFSDQDAIALASAPQFSSLRVLQLLRTDIGPEGAGALAQSPFLQQLEFLSLAQTSIGSQGAAALAASPNFSRLRFLDLWFTGLHDGIPTFADSPHLGQLRTLFLDRNDLGPDALVALASSPFLHSLSTLDLADNFCGLEGFRSLAESPLLTRMRALELTAAVFDEGDEVAEVLAATPGAAGLRFLGLSCNEMTDRGAQALASSPHLGNLWRLALHSNNFTGVGEEALTARFGDRWRLCWAD